MTFEELQYIVSLMREEVDRRRAELQEVRKPLSDLEDGYITEDELGEDCEVLLRKDKERTERLSEAQAYLALFLSRSWKL